MGFALLKKKLTNKTKKQPLSSAFPLHQFLRPQSRWPLVLDSYTKYLILVRTFVLFEKDIRVMAKRNKAKSYNI